ncbi:hypothetical protein BU24DRAFT_173248 [Aaosphaeria arxii CBS 175.79]|uniref:Uncharacterized protein n=1 Tax=Aaosphaeria arxii CBS 175.79 TaxID=1450172 RepID=A0A6A5XQJ3_9PLEO|nr:uncharacterized protein BU24DRAFT_173248 [Aaosphaeria arxii CBS 175.79]KAF2015203.1 hypothetical protein BU24DRAFT_173248 [Aaosphaeria arxii CBS 175.79]
MPPTAVKKTTKPIYRTENPFTKTSVPAIGQKHQDAILDILCGLLEPLGQHRQTHHNPSKGKKRKLGGKQSSVSAVNRGSFKMDTSAAVDDATPPPAPQLSNHVLIGLNTVTRHLTALAQKQIPSQMPLDKSQDDHRSDLQILNVTRHAENDGDPEKNHVEMRSDEEGAAPPKDHYAPLPVVIIPHPTPSASLAHAHLPTLIYISSLDTAQPTRLVCLPSSAETRLASALHIPRLGALAIKKDAPGAGPLIQYIREHVERVECPWIGEGLRAEWQGVKTERQTS